MAERSNMELKDAEAQEQVASSWRRLQQAIDSMSDAEESEDFQAVGVKCRDALTALAKDHSGDDWLGEISNRPRQLNSKAGATYSRSLTAWGARPAFLRSEGV
jgi:hypothetical protein